MQTLAVLRTLAGAELRNVRRDSLLRWMAAFPILLALLLRWLVPLIDATIELDLQPYYVLIMSTYAVLASPVLIGFIVGMLLLDERDDRTLQAIRVTPLSMRQYLSWKLSLPTAVTTLLTLMCLPLTGLAAFQVNFTAAALVGALWAPILALAMATFAKDKLQGFVLMRVTNALLLIPVGVWFFDARWEPLFALLPTYWPLKTFWLTAQGESYLLFVLIGAAYHAAIIAWLYGRFQRVLGRSG
jgi:fluoroquinolone transport system permease protein